MSDLLPGAAWGGATVLLFFACWSSASSLFPRDDAYRKALHALVLCWAVIAAAALALGACGLLTAPLLLAAVSLGSLALLAATRRLARSSQHASAVRAGEGEADQICPSSSKTAKLVEAAIWLFMASFWAYHVARSGLGQFPEDFDTLMYHLPLIDHWLQARSLYAPDAWQWSTPGNNELLGLWCAAPFSGDFLTVLTNAPATLILALAARELARQLGLGRLPASVCAAAVAANYVVLNQLVDVENDVAVAALTLASAAYGLRFARDGRRADLVLGGICIGLLAGVKFYALGYAAAVWLALTFAAAACRGWRAGVGAGLGAAALALCWGGYWYVRNWLVAGSPLYPKGLFGIADEMAHYYPNIGRTTFIGNGSPELFSLAMDAIWRMTGPLHLAAFYCLPLSVSWLALSGLRLWRAPSNRPLGTARIVVGCLVIAAGGVLISTPFAVEDVPGTLNQMKWGYCPVRYGMTFLSLAVLIFGAFLASLGTTLCVWLSGQRAYGPSTPTQGEPPNGPGRLRMCLGRCLAAAPCLALAALALYQVVFKLPKFEQDDVLEAALFAIDGCGLGIIVVWFGIRAWRRPRLLAAVGGAAAVASAAVGAGLLSHQWHAGFATFYDQKFEQGMFTALADPRRPPETVCVLDFRPYPFFGSRRQHRVCQPHRLRSEADFRDYLVAHHVTLVAARFDVTDLSGRGWDACEPCIAHDPSLFSPAKASTTPYALYRVQPLPAATDLK